jgi:hypothetical protein
MDVVQLRDGSRGLLCAIEAGHALAAAADGPSKTIVVLVGRQLGRYDSPTCQRKGALRVPAGVVPKLEAGAGYVAYRTRRRSSCSISRPATPAGC